MERSGTRLGFGVDENTALLVEGSSARVCGEYGVMLVDMRRKGSLGGFRLSYLDDGDGLDLTRFRLLPGPAKRRVRKREIAYRAPARSRPRRTAPSPASLASGSRSRASRRRGRTG